MGGDFSKAPPPLNTHSLLLQAYYLLFTMASVCLYYCTCVLLFLPLLLHLCASIPASITAFVCFYSYLYYCASTGGGGGGGAALDRFFPRPGGSHGGLFNCVYLTPHCSHEETRLEYEQDAYDDVMSQKIEGHSVQTLSGTYMFA